MADTVIAQIRTIQGMTVGELQVRWRELYGEDSRSRHKAFLAGGSKSWPTAG